MWGFALLLGLQELWTYQDSSLWRSNFIPLVYNSIIIIGSRSVTYIFGSRFAYKRWVRIFYQNLNFSFLGQVFQYFCWVSKRVDWDSQHIPIFLLGLKAYLLRFASLSLSSFLLYLFHLSLPSYCANKEEEEIYNKCGENLHNINKGNKAKPMERIYKTSRKEIKQSQ